jgi:HlyD family secretion protein
MKKWLLLLVVVLVLGVVAFGASRSMSRKGIKVRTQKVERGALVSTVTCNGKVEARRKVDLSANVPGQIVNLAVEEGDAVDKNDFLLQIDRKSLQAQYDSSRGALDALFSERDSSKAALEQAKLDLDRARISYESGLVARSDYDRAKTTIDQATASLAASENRIEQARGSLASAQDTLTKTTIRAPIAGVVTRLAVEEGEVAVIGTMNNPGTVLLTISDLSQIEAVMEVDETDIPFIKVGQRAKITIDAFPNKEFEGEVTEVASSPIQTAASAATEGIDFEVKIRLLAPPEGVKPGLSVSASITTAEKQDVLAVPLQALVIREKETSGPPKEGDKKRDEEGVYVLEGGKTKFAVIKTGINGELNIEVVSGLSGGEEIVTGPFKTLREIKDGQEVQVDNSLPKVDQKEGS